MEQEEIKAIIENILLAADQPVSETQFKNLLGSGVMSLLSLATNGGKLKLELEGYVRASALGLRKKIKVSTTEYIGL